MYTESFAGDIDAILTREAILSTLSISVTLPRAKGRADSYGFTRDQREALGAAIIAVGRAMMRQNEDDMGKPITIRIDTQRKIVLHTWGQAANLYQTLTKNCWFAGLEGTTGEPKIKRY